MIDFNENHMQRLVFSKFLFEEAKKYSKLPIPNNSVAILQLHDSVDIYIQLLCDLYGPDNSKKESALVDLINSLNNHLIAHKIDKIHVPPFTRLNKLRNRLKHESIFAIKDDIQSLVYIIEEFFATSVPLYINGLDYSSVSLINLITSIPVKQSLEKASHYISSNDFKAALSQINIAFYNVLFNFTSTMIDDKLRARIFPANWFTSLSKLQIGTRARLEIPGFDTFEKELKRSFDTLSDLIIITNLGINFQEYTKFKKYHHR